MARINYLQELRGLENRLEKKMDDAFDNFAMIIQKQFTELIKASEENRADTSDLRVQTKELSLQTAEIRASNEELKQHTIELRASNLKHDIIITELKASGVKQDITLVELKTASIQQDVTLAEVKDIARELKEISKNHQGRIVVLEEAFA